LKEVNQTRYRKFFLQKMKRILPALQSGYSLWSREVEINGVLATCRELGIKLAEAVNLNIREAYARACAQFLAWSENHVDDVRAITPMHVAACIEKHPASPQTIKQNLAAIKFTSCAHDYPNVNSA
jgi:hypothetical protein